MHEWAARCRPRRGGAIAALRFASAVLLWHGYRWASSQLLALPWLAALEVETELNHWEDAEGLLTKAGGAYASEIWHRLLEPGEAAMRASWPLLVLVLAGGVLPLWWALRAVGAGPAGCSHSLQLGRLLVLGWGLSALKAGTIALLWGFGATVQAVLLGYEDPRWASSGVLLVLLIAGLGVLLVRTAGDIAYAAIVDRGAPVAAAAEIGLSACLRHPLRHCGLSLSLNGGGVLLGALACVAAPQLLGLEAPSAGGRLLAGHFVYCLARTTWLLFALKAARRQRPSSVTWLDESALDPRSQGPNAQAQAR